MKMGVVLWWACLKMGVVCERIFLVFYVGGFYGRFF